MLVSRDDFADCPALLVMFLCNHCPYVRHVAEEIVRLAREYQAHGIGVVAISSNDVAQHPEDGPPAMAEVAAAMGATFPYLYDETQDVAKAYHAACTPDFFLFGADRRLAYRGQFDGARPGNESLSVAAICEPPSTPSWPAGPRPNRSCPASAATSSGSPATNPNTPRPCTGPALRSPTGRHRPRRPPRVRRSVPGPRRSRHVPDLTVTDAERSAPLVSAVRPTPRPARAARTGSPARIRPRSP